MHVYIMAGLQRCGKSCRLRWTNYLRPDLKHGEFAEAEEQIIVKLHSVVGNRYHIIYLFLVFHFVFIFETF